MSSRMGVALVAALLACGAVGAAAQMPDISHVAALHSFKDLPSLPVSVDSLAKYYGDVTTPDGQQEKGDLHTEVLRKRLAQWMTPTDSASGTNYAAMMQSPGTMTPGAAQALGNLAQVASQMNADLNDANQSFQADAVLRLRERFEDQVAALNKQYQPAIDRCLGQVEHAGGVPCNPDPTHERDTAINAAASALLKSTATPYEHLKRQMQQIAAQGEAAIAQANKAFGNKPPGVAQMQIQVIRQNELNALIAVLGAENDVVTYTFGHGANLKEGDGH